MSSRADQLLLSVIVPTHNVHSWIRETLSTILAQDLEEMEVIVVDDHSDDDTPSVVEELASTDARLQLVRAESRGGGSARNEGVARARGKYLVFCDGDDLVPEGAYRALVESLESSGSDIAFGDYLKFSPTDTWRPTANWPAYIQGRRGFTAAEVPSILYGRACWNKAFRRAFWDASGAQFPDVPRSNDIVPMVTTYLAAAAIDMIEDVVYLYRDRQGASSMSAKAETVESFLSYLTQELACAEMVRAADSPQLSRAYASLVIDRDGWVHLAKFLRSNPRDSRLDAEVTELLGRLVSATGRPLDHRTVPHKRLAFELAIGGDLDTAASLARLTSGPRLEVATELDEWAALIDANDVGTFGPLLDEEPWLTRLLAEGLAAAVLDGTESTDRRTLELAARAEEHAADIPVDAPELVAGDALHSNRIDTIRTTRRLDARLVAVASGNRLRLQVASSDARTAHSIVLLDAFTGVSTTPRTQDRSGNAVSATFHPRDLPLRAALIIAMRDEQTGEHHAVRFVGEIPPYDRLDRFGLHRRRETLEIRRRGHWATRAASKGFRIVARRLRIGR